MENINLSSIKRESVKAIYNSIAGVDKISRADISAKTGLSLMTVGKVVDALLGLNIITQSKEIKAAAGRKAGLISTNDENYSAILDLTSRNFSMVIINIKLEVVDRLHYTYNGDVSFSENLDIFLKSSLHFLEERVALDKCVGVGVSMPGPYDPDTDTLLGKRMPELAHVRVRERVHAILGYDAIFIESSVNVAAISNIMNIENYREKTVLYLFVGDYIAGTIMMNGEILHGMHQCAGNIGETLVSRELTLEESMRSIADPLVAACELARALRNLIKIIDPHIIILECEIFKKNPSFIPELQLCLREKFAISESEMPEFRTSGCKFRHSQRGLALRLREMWLDEVIRCQI